MARVPDSRNGLALAVLGVVAIAFVAAWPAAAAAWPAAAGQTAQDPSDKRSPPPTLDELLNRFPIGTERVTENTEPAPAPPASPQVLVLRPPDDSGSQSLRIALLAGSGAVVLLMVIAFALRRRQMPATQPQSTSSPSLLEHLAQAIEDARPAGFAHRTASASGALEVRRPQLPDALLPEIDRQRPAAPQPEDSAPAREPEHGDVGGSVPAVVSGQALQPAMYREVAERDEPAAPGSGDEVDYIDRNRAAWERWAPGYVAAGRRAWQEPDLRWGIWGIPESELRVFDGLGAVEHIVELGCGTATVSAWLARQGARPLAIDIAPTQLTNALTLQREFSLSFPLLCANAERVPLQETGFDLAISEYGASLWCDPRRWLPEAHRLLRPDGHLVFFTNGALLMACTPPDGSPATNRLIRDYFSSYRVEFPGDDAVEFHPTHGDWVRLLRANGFILEDLIEVRPPPEAKPARYEFAPVEWARRWSSEEIWVARKTAARWT